MNYYLFNKKKEATYFHNHKEMKEFCLKNNIKFKFLLKNGGDRNYQIIDNKKQNKEKITQQDQYTIFDILNGV